MYFMQLQAPLSVWCVFVGRYVCTNMYMYRYVCMWCVFVHELCVHVCVGGIVYSCVGVCICVHKHVCMC